MVDIKNGKLVIDINKGLDVKGTHLDKNEIMDLSGIYLTSVLYNKLTDAYGNSEEDLWSIAAEAVALESKDREDKITDVELAYIERASKNLNIELLKTSEYEY